MKPAPVVASGVMLRNEFQPISSINKGHSSPLYLLQQRSGSAFGRTAARKCPISTSLHLPLVRLIPKALCRHGDLTLRVFNARTFLNSSPKMFVARNGRTNAFVLLALALSFFASPGLSVSNCGCEGQPCSCLTNPQSGASDPSGTFCCVGDVNNPGDFFVSCDPFTNLVSKSNCPWKNQCSTRSDGYAQC